MPSHCHARMIICVATMSSEPQHQSVDERHWNYCFPRKQQVFSRLGHLQIFCVLHRTVSPLVGCGSSPPTMVLIMVWLVSSSSIHVIYSPPLAPEVAGTAGFQNTILEVRFRYAIHYPAAMLSCTTPTLPKSWQNWYTDRTLQLNTIHIYYYYCYFKWDGVGTKDRFFHRGWGMGVETFIRKNTGVLGGVRHYNLCWPA